MNEFQVKAEQIGRSFKTPVSAEWVASTGRRELVNGLLNSMRAARSRADFDRAAYEFKRQVLLPYYREVVYPLPQWQHEEFIKRNPLMDMKPRKPLGSWDEMRKNDAFAETQYRTRGTPADTTTHPQLMRIAQDPVELEMASRSFEVTPEELRSHIQDEFNRKARENFLKDMRAAAVEGQAVRDSIADAYEKSWYGKALGAVAPEVTGYNLQAIRSGKESGWDLAKAIAKDALVGISSLYTGGPAGKIATNPSARAGIQGLLDAGIEAGRQAMSNYYDWDPSNIRDVGIVSAGLPAAVGWASGMLGQLPGMGRIVRPIQRKLKGNVADPAEMERAANKSIQEEAEQAVLAAEGGDVIAQEAKNTALDRAAEFISSSPNRIADEFPLTRESVTDIVMDPEMSKKYFTPPSRDEVKRALEMRNTAGAENVVDVGGDLVHTSDLADQWLTKTKSQWKANYDKIVKPQERKTLLDKVVEGAVDFAGREETMRRRASSQARMPSAQPSPALEEVMSYDPQMIRMWEAGFVPNDEAGKKLYSEWKEKFGR